MKMLSLSLLVILLICGWGLMMVSCSSSSDKVSSLLLAQIELRKEQIAKPTADRLEQMKAMGMRLDNLEIQRIFIHLAEKLTPSQVEELEGLGITLYLDSWIPPVGAHPTGFLIADMPVDKLDDLASKDYVVRLDTAERLLKPQAQESS